MNPEEAIQALQAHVFELNKKLHDISVGPTPTAALLPPPDTTVMPVPLPSIRVAQPETYNGRKGDISLWLFQVQQYYNALNIKSDSQAVYYAVNLLRGDAVI